MTSTQLELLLGDVPGRTVRYRTERLHQAGLLGRSRPYREAGSAPFHLWPSRRADTLAHGRPAPRGGDRSQPNPLFLAHAASITELYALLATDAHDTGVRLISFQREPRLPFEDQGRERRLAPDALIELRDSADVGLLGFVELDLGTMSHARLKVKAAAYAAYAARAAWREQFRFCPCLLFITTTEARAVAFLKTLAGAIENAGRGGFYEGRSANLSWFAAGACGMGRDPGRALSETCFDDLRLSGGGLSLIECLRAARAPYDAAVAQRDAEQRDQHDERERLRSDPDAWRALLAEHHLYTRCEHFEQYGTPGMLALVLLLASTEPMANVEREAFAAISRQLDGDPLQARLAPAAAPPTQHDREAVARLADTYRARQREQVGSLARRYGVGPRLRSHQEQLAAGGLLNVYDCKALEKIAADEQQKREEQERLRIDYLHWREQEAKRRKHDVPLHLRLAHGHADTLARIDTEQLHVCSACDEIAYPTKPVSKSYSAWGEHGEPARCHYCGAHDLDAWDTRRAPEVEYGSRHLLVDGDGAGFARGAASL